MRKSGFPWASFLKKIAVIAVPVALQNLLTTTGSMVDTMMIASLGTTEVGAVGLCAQFSSLMFAGYWGFVGGGMVDDVTEKDYKPSAEGKEHRYTRFESGLQAWGEIVGLGAAIDWLENLPKKDWKNLWDNANDLYDFDISAAEWRAL